MIIVVVVLLVAACGADREDSIQDPATSNPSVLTGQATQDPQHVSTPLSKPTTSTSNKIPRSSTELLRPSATQVPRPVEYRIKPGDSIIGISQAHGIDVEDFLAINGLQIDSVIHPEQTVLIPDSSEVQAPRSSATTTPNSSSVQTPRPMPTVTARPSVDERQLFFDITSAEDRGNHEAFFLAGGCAADNWNMDIDLYAEMSLELMSKYRGEVLRRYGVSESNWTEILVKGVTQGWPTPPPKLC